MNDIITVAPPGMQALQHGTEDGVRWAVCGGPSFIGCINGYVEVPVGHPWQGLDYDDEAIDVNVHGGLTYGRNGWIGFDTAHLGDIWPGADPLLRDSVFGNKHWTEEMVVEETKSLARQVAARAQQVDAEFTSAEEVTMSPKGWQPIETAPKDGMRLLYLAHFSEDGNLTALDFDGVWTSESESWELPEVYYYWGSANGSVEEPTHWAYQYAGAPPLVLQGEE